MATRPPSCLDPLKDAERLNSNFAVRAATTNLPAEIQNRLQQLRDTRQEKIDEAVLKRDEGRNMRKTQKILDLIKGKCKNLGLKISREKSKAMFIWGRAPQEHLHIQDNRLE
ncbi:hypothetical protein Pmani_012272 [Petrolisthes manimaculis]|uniref:Uncharacterized protein n=1 Tax=Petrolisthes manimaculis TaxID=1843537 RepID=A0AAE1PZA6_9EUCA|nr:hypothetical protein Pmani_012272 [Petrolisthes manimaculis]